MCVDNVRTALVHLPAMRTPLAILCLLALTPLASRSHAAMQARGGINMVAVTSSAEGALLSLEDRRGNEVSRGITDRFGSYLFTMVEPGAGYLVRNLTDGSSQSVTVLDFENHPDQSFYEGQTLHEGYNYIQMRDGTLLAAMVRAPIGQSLANGPFPTVIEYSGYDPANPDSPQPMTLISSALGYATVGVNMRGSGCSGGVFDLFDLPTTADGYDIVETVAAQPWVKGGKVGMVGISFPGITQLFVGGAQPPHLAALSPFSVISEIYTSPGYPGGIFNNGFAESWLRERADDAEPAPEGGQSWARKRVREGDTVCLENQKLRLQTQDPVAVTQAYPFYTPWLMDNRSPINWVGKIQVPTFLASAWQDEQTGPGFATMLDEIPNRPDVKITVLNGVHASSLEPQILWNWLAFLDLYVAKQLPDPGRLAAIAPIIYSSILDAGQPTPPLPADRFDGISDYGTALRLFENDPHIRVLMENGAGSPMPGIPAPTFELGFSEWPPREVKSVKWWFGPDGTLVRRSPRGAGVVSYRPDPDARPQQTLPGDGSSDSWAVLPPYDWRPYPDGTAAAWATPPLDDDVTIVGPSSVDLSLRSTAHDTDIQVTLTEIRPDGKETYVQSGWLRASLRALSKKKSTRIMPTPTFLERMERPLRDGRFTRVRVPLAAVSHVFRAGSRIRISVEAPGGDRTRWRFDTPKTGGAVVNDLGKSRIVLPVVPGIEPPPQLPPCPGLRGQPCRTYLPAANGG
jgi:predicted acyl esterase